ncbi:MAG: glycine cleavage system protein GcvH [Proteobacteria bacterium]|nr:glycine cleavage system protein GcvH [Pseudomonadota bacterium]
MSQLRYTNDHEWVRVEGDTAVVGISDYAQEQLGDVVFVELPDVGTTFAQNDDAAVVESVKAASEIYAPIGGKILEVNNMLIDAPETLNSDPTGNGWMFKISIADAGEVDGLMDEAAYKTFVEGLE